jgi:choline-glycine betaine transporter
MDRELCVYAIVGVALVILGVLRGINALSEQNFMQAFMFVLGALLGGGVARAYYRMRRG